MLVLSIQVVLIPKIFPDTSLGLGWINDEGMAEHCLQLGSIGFSITCHLQVFLDSRDFLPGNLSDLEDVHCTTQYIPTLHSVQIQFDSGDRFALSSLLLLSFSSSRLSACSFLITADIIATSPFKGYFVLSGGCCAPVSAIPASPRVSSPSVTIPPHPTHQQSICHIRVIVASVIIAIIIVIPDNIFTLRTPYTQHYRPHLNFYGVSFSRPFTQVVYQPSNRYEAKRTMFDASQCAQKQYAQQIQILSDM